MPHLRKDEWKEICRNRKEEELKNKRVSEKGKEMGSVEEVEWMVGSKKELVYVNKYIKEKVVSKTEEEVRYEDKRTEIEKA